MSPREVPGYPIVWLVLLSWWGGTVVHVIARPISVASDTTGVATPAQQAVLPSRLIDINQASAGELRLLPAIGAVLAERIVADRASKGDFRSLEDIARVNGIGDRTIERISPYLTLTAPPPEPKLHPAR